jgi:hypothetical protein
MQHDYNGFPNQRIARAVAATCPKNATVVEHGERDLLLPVFDTEHAFRLAPNDAAPRTKLPTDAPVARDIDTPWDIAKHGIARAPLSLGIVDAATQEAFTTSLPAWCQHVLDMPIKFPGTDVRVPAALASFVPAIQRIIDAEKQLNPSYEKYYAYLSIHQSMVGVGERMRENPYHVDGFQGPRWTEKHPVNHSYLLSDQLPTVFYPIAFPMDHIDPNFDDIYAEFGARIEVPGGVPEVRSKDFELVLMDAYCVHRGDVATQPMFRTWLRVSWETRVFDRLGNAHNPLFDYDWKMVARDTDPRIRPRAVPMPTFALPAAVAA